MTLDSLLSENRLEKRQTSKHEIDDLFEVVSRSLKDAQVEQLSLDARFNCAYEAGLMLATITLRCTGYRTRGEGHHFAVFDVLPEIMGENATRIARYLQKCRKIRNLSTYSRSGIVSKGEVIDLIAKVNELDKMVRSWIKDNYPQYS